MREVGRGGMGIVYEAEQVSLRRRVAVKVLPARKLTEAAALDRFRRESRVAARLHHTNIVPVYAVGEHEGLHYYAMQFIQGQGLDVVIAELRRQREAAPETPGPNPDLTASLAQELETGRPAADAQAETKVHSGTGTAGSSVLSGLGGTEPGAPAHVRYFRSVARVGVQVAEALAHAHAHRVLHRDIKPSNLLLDTQGAVWVTDFGLAKSEDGGDLTVTGDIVGTLRYMAPERFGGQADERSDLYSLGLTLYELLTLRPAFAAPSKAQLIEQILHDEPARPRALDARIPRDLETVVLKAMAREPKDRYQSAQELADDLGRFLGGRPILARPVGL
ncbi:MAG TPA: serine/threonine-protein kinase, partial [Vicinamibacteria bacterium]|nr:serine/threonine-protein kinase [Vicinamibacteria bacterium]